MKTSDFSFELPEELIAQHPSQRRDEARLMVVNRSDGSVAHRRLSDLPGLLPADSLLVLNNTRVRKARLFGTTEHGGSVEFLLLEQLDASTWKTLASKSKRQKRGRRYRFPDGVEGEITAEEGQFRHLRFTPAINEEYLQTWGRIPLPPYIRREATEEDEQRYQTVFADRTGSVAAPTAGLHFTPAIFKELEQRGIERAEVTLHVGIGTFSPIRTEKVEQHRMHSEHYEVPEPTADAVNLARSRGRQVCAVGTTSVRTLESAADEAGTLQSGEGHTDLYIYPGYRFRVVDAMLTNFHTPESSLLVMVSAFAGKELIDRAYREAVRHRYRFFSYGDAMLIL
jgi:S-adenosylmethionine:tRNA ribosyltransferase-isomerase